MAEPQQVAPTLELISAVLPGRLYELDKDLIRIGRDPSSDICLNRIDVSWHHARILRRTDGFYVENAESRGGMYVDRVRVPSEVPLRLVEGARIRICDNQLIFRCQAVKVEDRQ